MAREAARQTGRPWRRLHRVSFDLRPDLNASGRPAAYDRPSTSLMATDQFPCFDGIRAIAALSVIFFHAAYFATNFNTPGGRYLFNFNAGVSVFFVTSGFLLYRPFAAAHFGNGSVDVRRYLVRRAARIYPAYWLALLFFTFVVPKATIIGFRGFVLHSSLTYTYVKPRGAFGHLSEGIPVAWSLVVELSFYLFLPLYAAVVGVLGRRRPWRAQCIGLASLGLIGMSTVVLAATRGAPDWLLLPRQLHVFALGMLLAVLSLRPENGRIRPVREWLEDHAWVPWSLALAVLLVLSVAFDPQGSRTVIREVSLDFGHALIGLLVVLPAVVVTRRGAGIARLLRHAAVVSTGTISYGLYLWHYLLLREIQAGWLEQGTSNQWIVLLAVGLPLVALAATVSWILVERPALRLAHRSFGRARIQ